MFEGWLFFWVTEIDTEYPEYTVPLTENIYFIWMEVKDQVMLQQCPQSLHYGRPHLNQTCKEFFPYHWALYTVGFHFLILLKRSCCKGRGDALKFEACLP